MIKNIHDAKTDYITDSIEEASKLGFWVFGEFPNLIGVLIWDCNVMGRITGVGIGVKLQSINTDIC